MAPTLNRILAVIDPTRRQQWALRKAVMIAQGRKGIEVTAYLAAFSSADAGDANELREVELHRQKLWLNELLAEHADSGVAITPIVEWQKDWAEAAIAAALESQADIVVKNASGKPKSLGSTDRQMIRGVRNAVMLINREPKAQLGTLLVALDFNASDEAHQRLNDDLLEIARRVRGVQAQAELHVVNAFPDSEFAVRPMDLAKKVGVERGRAHSKLGKPAEVIAETANTIGAELVMIGTVGRSGLSGLYIGNTAEKILGELDCDVLILGTPS
jgi:universal stress protein E